MTPRRSGSAMVVIAVVGLAVAAYLAITKLIGTPPVCGPLQGCETVANSGYSEWFGIPVAVFGIGFSVALVAVSAVWRQTEDRRALVGAYALGLLGCFVVAGLTYLELFVIHAICVYCVTYAMTIVAGFVVAVLAMRANPAD
jgi:uncharacterized membrane protein